MDLKPYYDAARESDDEVTEIANRIDALFKDGNKDEALALRPELDEAKESAQKANELYLSMRNAHDGESVARMFVPVNEKDFEIGMSDKEVEQYSLLRAIDAQVTGDWSKAGLERETSQAMAAKLERQPQGFFVPWDIQMAPIKRPVNTQQVGDPTKGGYLVEEQLRADSFIDVLRNAMVLRQAGARVMTGLVGDIDIPKKTATSTAYWIGEGNAPSASTLSFGQVAARPRTVAAYMQLTRKFIKQSSLDAEMMARDDMAQVLALGIDYAGLFGLGSANQPLGIRYVTGIGSVVGGTNGAAPDWDDVVDLETEVATDNAALGQLGYVTNAKVRGALKKTFRNSTYGEIPVWEGGATPLNDYPAYVTNQIPSTLVKGSSSVCSALFFGNWDDLVFLFWGGLDVLVDPYTNSTSGDVLITAMQDADVVVRRSQSFAAMLDALAG